MLAKPPKPRPKFFAANPIRVEDTQNDIDMAGAEKLPKEIQVIAQEVKIVRSLASNDLTQRNRQMRKLRKWLQLRKRSSFPFTDGDFMRIWKGLYYNMWMSDKPLVQEQLAEQLGKLLECFDGDAVLSVHFFGAFLRTMCQHWFGIDHWRMDKFMLLVRRMLRYVLRVMKAANWSAECVKCFNEHVNATLLAEEKPAVGLTMHFFDIFLDELAKVANGDISGQQVSAFVLQFLTFIGVQRDFQLVHHCRRRIFLHLLYQSELGREYTERYLAWKEMGFPTGSINAVEKVACSATVDGDDDEDEAVVEKKSSKEQVLDPRAGNVDAFVPELPLDGKAIVDELEKLIYKRDLSTNGRKILKALLSLFKIYQTGSFPLGIKTMPQLKMHQEKPLVRESVVQLENLENEMYATSRLLKQLSKRKRRQLLKSLNSDDVDEANYEQAIKNAIPKDYLTERIKRSKRAAMMSGWVEEAIEVDEVDKPVKQKKQQKNKETATEVEAQRKEKRMKLKQQHKNLQLLEDAPAEKVAKIDAAANNGNDCAPEEDLLSTPKAVNLLKNAGKQQMEDTPRPRLLQTKKNSNGVTLVPNPLAKKFASLITTPKQASKKEALSSTLNTPSPTGSATKRVKIMLKNNTVQNPSEYIRQIKSSPNVPFDADRKPGKGLLKPNLMPSPINPYYKKKIGLRINNDTI